ncbi:MAG: flagellar basal body rod protein FlgB [Deltaproteobacteria bacterium]|nr:flagellar basal body rod protein FlgB [Deltaproteobacteria bacterium]MCB9787788.1 flagellar basal body rod protein FlgB [Deltaproteobacteria bacterium]
MRPIGDDTGAALEASMDLRFRRQELLAGNIANADTPGYTPRDLSFEGALAQAMADDVVPPGFVRTHDAHLPATDQTDHSDTVVERPDVTNTLDGNGVDLDLEMARLADNSIRFNTSVEAFRRRGAMLVGLISEMSRI